MAVFNVIASISTSSMLSNDDGMVYSSVDIKFNVLFGEAFESVQQSFDR